MKRAKCPSVSIIICTYNRAEELEKTLTALSSHVEMREGLEVIVVDDCSGDNTRMVAEKFGFIYEKTAENRGIGNARNTGLRRAGNDIVIYLDDDCQPSKEWLPEIIRFYEDEDVMAVGGSVLAQCEKTLASRYMLATCYGNPRDPKNECHSGIVFLDSLKSYFLTNLYPVLESKEDILSVNEIYGANSSFRRDILMSISGYDDAFETAEDTEICHRLKKNYPHKKIIYSKKAVVRHKHYTSMKFYLNNTMSRAGKFVDLIISSKRMVPPVYPVPILFLMSIAASLYFGLTAVVFSMFLLPGILCFWWPVRAVRERKGHYLVFPVVQILLETAFNLGVIQKLFIYCFKRK